MTESINRQAQPGSSSDNVAGDFAGERGANVQWWHPLYAEPCEHGPANADDAACAEHRICVVPAGQNRWPTDLNNLGGDLCMRAYTATNWFDVIEVLSWRGIDDKLRLSGRGVEYTLVIDNGGTPVTVTTDTVSLLSLADLSKSYRFAGAR